MGLKAYPVIDLAATGDNIRRLRMAHGRRRDRSRPVAARGKGDHT